MPAAEPIAELAAELDEPVVVLEPLEECEGMEVQERLDDHAKMPQQGLKFPKINIDVLTKRFYNCNITSSYDIMKTCYRLLFCVPVHRQQKLLGMHAQSNVMKEVEDMKPDLGDE